MKLVVGLGNPGHIYAGNRHNIGFTCVRHLARSYGIRFDKKEGQARTGRGEIEGIKVVLARPQTFMNASGETVGRLVKRLKIAPADLVVIHDDLDLPLGKIRLGFSRSSGGHKGIESIIARLGSRDFYRVRVGIGRPDTPEVSPEAKKEAVIDHVLDGFTPEEKKVISRVVPRVGEAVVRLLTGGITAAMNEFN
ncbi:MAG TPA: aminoacyl-tRNA hydrolase [Dehalococcoidales bacterium]|nr:aminoacyl-tRNA hydrolase [Dehalococcoidales bacterium]